MSYEDLDADDLLLKAVSRGKPAARWPSVGHVVSGYITDRPKKTEQRDADNVVKKFDDGTVRMQVLIDIQTTERDPDIADDDGQRTVWCKWEIQKAVAQAMLDAGVRRLEIGGFLEIARNQDIPPVKKTYKPTQTFLARYTPPAQKAADDVFASAAQTVVQPQFSGPPQPSEPVAAAQPRITTLDQLKDTSFSAQGFPQDQKPPF